MIVMLLGLIPMDKLNILAWNMRGINHPLKRKELRSSIHNWDVLCGAILETRIRHGNLDEFVNSWDSTIWKTSNNSSLGKNCRIFIF